MTGRAAPAGPEPSGEDAGSGPVSLDARTRLLRQYGSFTQAYSATHQPGLQHFGDERGFLAYKVVTGTAMVLSDPITAPQHREALVRSFLKVRPDACFCQISKPVAALLRQLGFVINELGPDTRIDLLRYDFTGAAKRNLRKATATMNKLGYSTREGPLSTVSIAELQRVSKAWRQTRAVRGREVAFLNRPIVFEDEPDVRRFFTFGPDGKLLGFGFFDPVYEDGAVVGYSMATRRLPEAHPLIGHGIKRHAIETFRREGKKVVYLGLSPGHAIQDGEFKSSKGIRRGLRLAYGSRLFNRFVYPLQGLALNKRQFGGTPEQTYFAFNQRPSIPRLIKVLRACEIV